MQIQRGQNLRLKQSKFAILYLAIPLSAKVYSFLRFLGLKEVQGN